MARAPLTPKDELIKLGGGTGAPPALQGAGTPQRGSARGIAAGHRLTLPQLPQGATTMTAQQGTPTATRWSGHREGAGEEKRGVSSLVPYSLLIISEEVTNLPFQSPQTLQDFPTHHLHTGPFTMADTSQHTAPT